MEEDDVVGKHYKFISDWVSNEQPQQLQSLPSIINHKFKSSEPSNLFISSDSVTINVV
jgi:hypothetical protein